MAGSDKKTAQDQTRFRVLAAAIAALVLLAAGLNLSAWFIRSRFMTAAQKAAQVPVTFYPAENAPPEPRLEANPLQDLQALHDKEDALLKRYRWIDKPKGIVQIPVDRAMVVLAERGLPARHGKADR
jgi:hypothetical protein